MNPCPSGSYADSKTRRCMDVCSGVQYGFYNATSGDRICLYQCPDNLWGYWPTKTCVPVCPNGTFG